MAHESLSQNVIRILDFDASVIRQENFIKIFSTLPHSLQIINLSNIASSIRYLSSKKRLFSIKDELNNTCHNAITLYGSGDFHHVSLVLFEQFTTPFSLIVFDHHPDWDSFSLGISCGSWVTHASKNENIKKIMLLGPSSSDLSTQGLVTASFSALKNKRLEVFPYEKSPSRVFFRHPEDKDCFKVKRGIFNSMIYWSNLKEKDAAFYESLLSKLPTEDVYISIDKDCLLNNYAFTNWDEGEIKLDWLLDFLKLIKKTKNVIGLDITGEYSEIFIKNHFKNLLSAIDHPKPKAIPDIKKINSINEKTNIKILKSLLE